VETRVNDARRGLQTAPGIFTENDHAEAMFKR
jgi:hypothetical protein